MSSFDFSTIKEVQLSRGAHASPTDGLCFMEMVAWFAGEPHSDRPECASPVLGSYGIVLNDTFEAKPREHLLKPLVPMIAGTRGSLHDDWVRAKFLTLWTVSKVIPIALRAYRTREMDGLADLFERAAIIEDVRYAAAMAERAARAGMATMAATAEMAEMAARATMAAKAAMAEMAAMTARAQVAARAEMAEMAEMAARAARAEVAAMAAMAEMAEMAVEGLRQAILIGPHVGFDAWIDLPNRHRQLVELVAA